MTGDKSGNLRSGCGPDCKTCLHSLHRHDAKLGERDGEMKEHVMTTFLMVMGRSVDFPPEPRSVMYPILSQRQLSVGKRNAGDVVSDENESNTTTK